MSSSDSRCCINRTERVLPTNRDLDRLASTLRAVAAERDFPARVIDRYQEWTFLFVGWSVKAPPGTVSRSRIGDFWTALNEHPGAGMAQICEAMDALGFFFGVVLRETDVLPLADPGMAGPEASGEPNGPPEDSYTPINPCLRAPDRKSPSSRETFSDPELSRYLPGGRLPEAPDARATVPTRPTPRNDRRNRSDGEPTQDQRGSTDGADDPRSSQNEESPSDTPTTLFNPEGKAPSPSQSEGHTGRLADENHTACESDDPTAGARRRQHDPEARTEVTVPFLSDIAPDRSADRRRGAEDNQKNDQGEHSTGNIPVEIPRPVADRLRRMAHRLGLPPTVCAARAIEMVCDDAGVERSEAPSVEAPLKHYQAQLDMLQLQKEELDVPISETGLEK
ncbi:MAG: hypothetical protein V5A22_05200 [Salinivenus sp.]